jgi:hypothetical protein
MSTTESINKIVLEFCNDLLEVYPEYKDKIENLSGKIDQNQKTKYYLEYYVRHVYPYMSSIARCDSEKCSEDNFSIMHGIKFQNIWKESVTLSTKHAIWRYLHTFYLLIQRHPKIGLVLEKYKEHEEYARMKEVFDKSDEYVKDIMESSSKFAEEILKEQANNASNGENGGNPFINPNMDEKDFENKFLNSGIGNLAKEISEEINPADLEGLNNPEDLFSSLLGGKGGNAGIGNLIQKVGSKLQNKLQSGELNEQSLINEAQNMMGMLNPDMKNMMGMGSMFNAFSGMGGGGKKKKKNSRRSKNRK